MPTPIELLYQLAAAQNLRPSTNIDLIVGKLRRPLRKYAELEFRSDGRRIDLITLTHKPHEANSFLDLLTELGHPKEHLANAESLLRLGTKQTVGMKIPVAGSNSGGELYLRGAVALPRLLEFLSLQATDRAKLDYIEIIAGIFKKNYTHMLATDAGKKSAFTLFFTTYLRSDRNDQEWETLQQALEILGIPQEISAHFYDSHHQLSSSRPETLYFSFRLKNGQLRQLAKFDYSAVDLESLAKVMTNLGFTPAAEILLDSWGKILGVRRASYAGLIIKPEGVSGVRAYFTVDSSVFAK